MEVLPRLYGRVRLRRLEPGDLAAFQRYRLDPEVGRYQGWTPMPDSAAIEFLSAMNRVTLFPRGEWCQLGIADSETNELIGDIGLHVLADGTQAEIGVTLSRDHQGRGLATVAAGGAIRLVFELTHVVRVIGITDARNTASIRLLERLGMRQFDTLNAIFRGEPCIEYVFAIPRPDAG